MWALEEFFLSMLCVNIADGHARRVAGRALPQRLLVIDEFGTFAAMAARIHHSPRRAPGRSRLIAIASSATCTRRPQRLCCPLRQAYGTRPWAVLDLVTL